jgi:hypothetical protein
MALAHALLALSILKQLKDPLPNLLACVRRAILEMPEPALTTMQ